ncbi:MAG: beta-ketoacyl-ACP synthase III [Desulfobacteraceae bacterium]|jgi:3-oxoacyl-[acyl-carrier-protein] synthase-3
MPTSHIIGTGSSVPQRVLANKDLEGIVETSDEWITRRTGIKERRIASKHANESTTDMGSQAAKAAMEMARVTADQIDTIIVATVTADHLFPSAACMIQKELEANNAAAFDVSAGCSGFVYALESANNSIRLGQSNTVLVVGAERLSSVVNWKDRSTCVLLGDGAGAVVLRGQENSGGILSTHIKSDGRLWDLLHSEEGNDYLPDELCDTAVKPFILTMEGNRLFKKAVGSMADITEQALEQNGIKRDDIQIVVPHQANLRILQAVADKLKVPMEKFFTNLHKYGNTSSGSIPLALDEAHRKGLIAKGDNVLLVSFGAGLTWGAAVIQWTV